MFPKFLQILILALLIACQPSGEETGFEFTEDNSCLQDPLPDANGVNRQEDLIKFTQPAGRAVEIHAYFNCAAKAAEPRIERTSEALILRVREEFPVDEDGGPIMAMCNCRRKLTFNMEQPIQPGSTVVFQKGATPKVSRVAP